MQPSEQIKSNLDIVDVLKEYIKLQSAGVNFRSLCPFHKEKSPSFVVSPEKQIWHCFGCGKGGDIFSFVMEYEGINFVEALRLLAPKAGVVLKRSDPQTLSRRNRLLDLTDLAKRYYYEVLLKSNQAEKAREYLKKRGVDQEIIDEWQIGYAIDSWDDLINFLKSRGFSDKEIAEAGLAVQKQGTNRFYNRFRGRIMFPIDDVNNNTVGFSGRISPEKEDEDKMGKYINTPQTMLYDKSKILFGLSRAKQEIKRKNFVVVMEGQMDVITAHTYRFKNTVAQSGTALTADNNEDPYYLQKSQLNLLKRYTDNIYLAFDSDNAGQNAIERAENAIYNNLLSEDLNIKIVEIPFGKDPDEAIKESAKKWEEALEKAKDLMSYHFDRILKKYDLATAEGRQEIAKKVLTKISKITDSIKKDYWLKKLSETINIDEKALREALEKSIKAKKENLPRQVRDTIEVEKKVKKREEILSENFLALLLRFSSMLPLVVDSFSSDYIFGKDNKEVYKSIIIYYNENKENEDFFNYEDFKKIVLERSEKNFQDQPKILNFIDRLVLLGERDFYQLEKENAKIEFLKILKLLKNFYRNKRKEEMWILLKQAEINGDEEQIKYLMIEINNLNKDID